ncbi:MAG: hypothetical protein QOF78_99 [Phycisphaerales bacterium]|jgi:hypothetical protein|nr:hypothetical protein [Phycisphaerales bacterium]
MANPSVRGVKFVLAIVFAVGAQAAAATATIPPLYTPAPSFNLNSRITSTTVFHWFSANNGQLAGPWRPPEGRAAWDGSVPFWKGQIKDIMDANIDVMYVHLIPGMTTFAPENQRVNLFTAAAQLRAEGYKTPRIAPFLDPIITWEPDFGWGPIDVATPAGKDAWAGQYVRFYQQYFSVNTDASAGDFIAKINNKPIINTWLAPTSHVQNMGSLTRADVESRLSAQLGPLFASGVHAVRPVNAPAPTWSDEAMVQFESNAQYLFTAPNANGVKTAQVKPGYWDQNIRTPGQILKRDGGVNYKNAWSQVNSMKTAGEPLYRVNIESWNEYDEGSGIHAASPGAPYIAPSNTSGNTDTWSTTNNPREYIDATAAGARSYNDTPDRDARFLFVDFPSEMFVGERKSVTVIVRNEGDIQWPANQSYNFGQQDFQPGEVRFIDQPNWRDFIIGAENEISTYGGIFRGRPVKFEFDLVAPATAGTYQTHWGMVNEGVTWFGQTLTAPITVSVPEPAGAGLILASLASFAALRRRRRWSRARARA